MGGALGHEPEPGTTSQYTHVSPGDDWLVLINCNQFHQLFIRQQHATEFDHKNINPKKQPDWGSASL